MTKPKTPPPAAPKPTLFIQPKADFLGGSNAPPRPKPHAPPPPAPTSGPKKKKESVDAMEIRAALATVTYSHDEIRRFCQSPKLGGFQDQVVGRWAWVTFESWPVCSSQRSFWGAAPVPMDLPVRLVR